MAWTAREQRANLVRVGACHHICVILSFYSVVLPVRVGARVATKPLVRAMPVASGVAVSELVSTKVGN